MKEEYQRWIDANVQGSGYAKCQEYTCGMHAVFPELIICKGFYHCPTWGSRTHWWLKTMDGEIVDPTKNQFPSKGRYVYTELTEEDIAKLPTGVCANCGEEAYEGEMFCSGECAQAFRMSCVSRGV